MDRSGCGDGVVVTLSLGSVCTGVNLVDIFPAFNLRFSDLSCIN